MDFQKRITGDQESDKRPSSGSFYWIEFESLTPEKITYRATGQRGYTFISFNGRQEALDEKEYILELNRNLERDLDHYAALKPKMIQLYGKPVSAIKRFFAAKEYWTAYDETALALFVNRRVVELIDRLYMPLKLAGNNYKAKLSEL